MTAPGAHDEIGLTIDATPETDHSDEVVPDDEGATGFLARRGLTTWDGLAIAAAVLLVVAFVPAVFFESWTPRMAIVLAIGPTGLVLLGRLGFRRDRAAVALALALAWTLVSALVGPAVRSSLLGFVGRDLSALAVVLSSAFWSLGIAVSDRGGRVLIEAVVWAGSAERGRGNRSGTGQRHHGAACDAERPSDRVCDQPGVLRRGECDGPRCCHRARGP